VIVFDDYAENIQENQVKTAILASFSGFFPKKTPIFAHFQGKSPRAPSSAGGQLQTANL
jgi:hypothetical protein